MTIGIGILIAAIGAVLRFAVTGEVDWIDIQTAGTILIVTGLAIALIALIATMASRRRDVVTAPAGYRRRTVMEAPAPAAGYPAAPVDRRIVADDRVDSAQI